MTSPKQCQANRANAQKSTGPKTRAGKEVSRRNARKHGLAGSGVVLSPEDEALFHERLRAWTLEEQPRTEGEAALLAEAVLASVHVDRCARDEFDAMDARRHNTLRNWQRRQDRRIRLLAANLQHDPAAAALALEQFASGCGWLVEQWQPLVAALTAQGHWSPDERAHALRLLGANVDPQADADTTSATAAQVRDLAALVLPDSSADPAARNDARTRLMALVDAEIDRLSQEQAALWYDDEAPALAESINLATIDLSRAGALRHRYTVAATSALHRALAEFSRRRNADLSPAEAGAARPFAASPCKRIPHPIPPAPARPQPPSPPGSAATQPAFPNEAIEPSSSASTSTTCDSAPPVTKPAPKPISTAPTASPTAPNPASVALHPHPPPGPAP